jgi:hypothetical protein
MLGTLMVAAAPAREREGRARVSGMRRGKKCHTGLHVPLLMWRAAAAPGATRARITAEAPARDACRGSSVAALEDAACKKRGKGAKG